ncbi:hypothetical protein EW145_g3413 [Phellinidium pouzarii]|uniref:Major facilitator superfamily (MFS) profile domain-containing protein n=1 Tax=Phellinidium pouzarii TaxID=167371 RepID=A0A4V3XCW6_9AGAM|nr:hypothetical protein EW145_g3413 [Phellinidium pouzarii]
MPLRTNSLASSWRASFAAFGGILYGYDTGIISGVQAMEDWLRTFGVPVAVSTTNPTGYMISTGQKSLVVSILSAGTFTGALIGAPVADICGRKWGTILATLVFSVGVAMQVAATAWPLFIVGRVIAGLGVGLVSVLIPMYQSECAPKWIRGAVVSGYQWAIAIDRDADAAAALARLTGTSPDDLSVREDLDDIRANLEEERRLSSSSYLDCFRVGEPNKICFRMVTGMALQGWQQLTGINFIFYYGTTFFQNSGVGNAFLVSVATNVVNVFMTIPGIWGVERFGRRRLLLVGAIGMCVCEFIVAIAGVTLPKTNLAGQKVLVAFVCIYIAFFASTWGPIAWVVVGEIYPLNVRAKGMSFAAASNWLWNFGIGYATPYLVDAGPGNANLQEKVFFIWGTTCFCCIVFTYFCIPETKGLSLEQIDILYTHSTPRTSGKLRARLLAEDVHAADHRAFEKEVGEEIRDDNNSGNEKV